MKNASQAAGGGGRTPRMPFRAVTIRRPDGSMLTRGVDREAARAGFPFEELAAIGKLPTGEHISARRAAVVHAVRAFGLEVRTREGAGGRDDWMVLVPAARVTVVVTTGKVRIGSRIRRAAVDEDRRDSQTGESGDEEITIVATDGARWTIERYAQDDDFATLPWAPWNGREVIDPEDVFACLLHELDERNADSGNRQ